MDKKRYNLQLAEIITNARKRKGLTQQELSNKLGIKRSRYSQYELANSTLPMDIFVKICDILELDYGSVMRSVDWQGL